jgi:hypothetical protein
MIRNTFETATSKTLGVVLALSIHTNSMSENMEPINIDVTNISITEVKQPTFLSDVQDERTHVVNKFINTFVEKMEEPDPIVQKVLEDNLWDLV